MFQKSITIDIFTTSENAFSFSPVEQATKFIPNWWKNLSTTCNSIEGPNLKIQRPTMKTCQGFIDQYKQGCIIPLWSDCVIETTDDMYKYVFADAESEIGNHHIAQMGEKFSNFIHVKLKSPWFIKETKGIKFQTMQPTWNTFDKKFTVLPGVVDYKIQHTTDINILLEKNQRYELSQGQPLLHILPITEKNVAYKCHYITEKEFNKIFYNATSYPWFLNSYSKLKKYKK